MCTKNTRIPPIPAGLDAQCEVPKGGVRNEDRGESRVVVDLINSHSLVDLMLQLSKCQMFVGLSIVARASLSDSGIDLLGMSN
jgi:hypothetical protein